MLGSSGWAHVGLTRKHGLLVKAWKSVQSAKLQARFNQSHVCETEIVDDISQGTSLRRIESCLAPRRREREESPGRSTLHSTPRRGLHPRPGARVRPSQKEQQGEVAVVRPALLAASKESLNTL